MCVNPPYPIQIFPRRKENNINVGCFSEKDFWLRAGTFDPSIYQKKILLSHIFFKLLSFKFLSFFFVITFCLFILLRKQNFFCKKTITFGDHFWLKI